MLLVSVYSLSNLTISNRLGHSSYYKRTSFLKPSKTLGFEIPTTEQDGRIFNYSCASGQAVTKLGDCCGLPGQHIQRSHKMDSKMKILNEKILLLLLTNFKLWRYMKEYSVNAIHLKVRNSRQGLPLWLLAPGIKDLAMPLHGIKLVTSRTHRAIYIDVEYYKIPISITCPLLFEVL